MLFVIFYMPLIALGLLLAFVILLALGYVALLLCVFLMAEIKNENEQ